jgi:TatD DNase family protein
MRNEILSVKGSPENRPIRQGSLPASAFYSVGIHPWHVDTASMDEVREYAVLPAIVAIGETGLDRISAKDADRFGRQQELFSAHAELSEQVRKPLIIHCVKAWEELLRIRKTIRPTMPWVIHGFRGKDVLASQLVRAGCYLSFGKYYHTEALRVAWQEQRLLTETDDAEDDIRNVCKQIAAELDVTEEMLSEEIARFFSARILISC